MSRNCDWLRSPARAMPRLQHEPSRRCRMTEISIESFTPAHLDGLIALVAAEGWTEYADDVERTRRAALELLAAARDEDAFQGLDRSLSALPQAPVTRAACERAISASRELAGERRLPAADYLIAAAAAERGFGVLHYDCHFDPLCRVLGIEGVLLGPRGSLD
jgi:predicted nucleic acid-binding protein